MDLLARVRAECDSGDITTLRDWIAEHPPPDDRFTQTLAGAASRVRDGEQVLVATREFLDEFGLRPRADLRAAAISDRPAPTGDQRADAYLAALAEHLAGRHDLARPDWCTEPARFLEHFWFVSPVPSFRALAVAESPAAFRRRGIFVSAGSLTRY